MKLLTFKLTTWKLGLERKVKEYNRIINNCTIKSITKGQKKARRNACKIIIEINEAIKILNNNGSST